MLSRSDIPQYQSLRLDRAARLTGEAFGFDDTSPSHLPHQSGASSWVLWMLVASVAASGLFFIALR